MSQTLQPSRKYLLCARERSTGGGVAELVALLCEARPEVFLHHPIGRSADRGWGAVVSDPRSLLRRVADPGLSGVVLHPSIRPRALARDAVLARCVLAAGKPLFVWWHGMGPRVARASMFVGLREGLRQTLGRARAHFVLTDEAEAWVRSLAPDQPVHRVRTCWDPSWLGGRRADPGGGGPWLFLGRLSRQKGVWMAARAVAQTPGARLVIAGEGPEAAALDRWVRREGLEGRIQRVGYLSGEDKARHLLDARGLLLPSLGEGAPLAVVEAMAAGLPILASRVGAIPEMVGDAGCLFEAGDQAGLTASLGRLEGSEVERVSMGEVAAERASGWTSARVASDFLTCLNEACDA